ncbi:sugar ABC transporter substrate-binding protein [Embleya sp. NBC_00896]|uniref:sugar ABC transporter substrate-binding protein n=1 Tax=Embleya sp. NBC_00896 TaxID=2975961 RepID=UPI002F91B36D|nr:sugar ABC transporter substrate-binding protein [Embleya sp. NBC_00896]
MRITTRRTTTHTPRRGAALTVAACAALVLTLTACGQEGGSGNGSGKAAAPPAADNKAKVCLVMKSLGNEYFQSMQKGAEQHAKELGTVDLTSVGIQNETDIDGQVAAIDKCITQKARALVIAPADSKALIAPIKRAASAGLKIVNIDVKLDDGGLKSAGLDVPFVGPDNTDGAKQSGTKLVEALGPGAKVVILEGNPGAANAEQRKAGFQAAVTEGKLTLLDSKTAHWETDEAYTVVSNMLTAHPDIQGVLASNDSMALGALKAIKAAGKDKRIKLASFDNIEAIAPFVQDGSVVATIDQFPSKQAGDGIDQALKLLSGQPVTGWIKTDIKVVTKAG